MSSKRAEPRSIASQLVWLFTGAATLLLLCGLGVFYGMVVRHTFEEDEAFLADKIADLRAQLREPGAINGLNEQLKITPRGEHAYWIRIVDLAGGIGAETPGINELLPADIFPEDSEPPKDYRTRGKLFSLVTTMEKTADRSYAIQAAQDRSEDIEFAREFGLLLIVVVGCGILAATAIAITVTKRGLRPLSEMAHAFERIGPTHLNERVAAAKWPRELQPMARAFDGMLERLEDSFTRLSQFSADLAHELRTPIGNLLGESQVALTRARTTDEYREVIESGVAECERLSGIIDNLLFLARAEAADREIERQLFDGRAAIEKVASFYEPITDEQAVSLACEGEAKVWADPILFSRAVSNLIENALHFTPGGGTIRVAVTNEGISVTDSGSGIAAEHIPRVFDRLYRADESRSSKGTGLGLAIVKSIVELHGGSVSLKSEVGRGTTVTLVFPNKRAAA